MLQFVVASQVSRESFLTDTALGRSVRRLLHSSDVSLRLWAANTRGLSELYNTAIEDETTPEYVVFLHDDIYIEDFFIYDRVVEGLSQYDVLGLAGSLYQPGQVRWGQTKGGSAGAVAQGPDPLGKVYRFGPNSAPVDLLDGLFIAAKTETLRRSGVRFDPAFKFHFYDLDFSLTAKRAGLRVGVWPISVTHQSRGNFKSTEWLEGSVQFAEKWKDVTF